MKILIGIVLALAMSVIGVCIFKTCKEEHKLAFLVRRILQIGFVIVLVNTVSLFSENELVCLVTYSVYFVSSDWLLYYLLYFSIEYIGSKLENHVNKRAMIALLIADSASVFANNFFGHLFTLNRVEQFGGEIYFELITTPAFYIHYGIVLMLVVFCLISLFYRAFTAPMFYRKKYMMIAVVLVAIVVMNICFIKSAIDYSVIGYFIEGMCIYYCAFVYTPQRLLAKTIFAVAQDMSVALLVLDVDGKQVYANNHAQDFLSSEDALVNGDGMSLEQWCREKYMTGSEDFTLEQVFYSGDDELILKIQLQKMKDGKDHLQGGYFVIQDCTEEYNKLKKERYLMTHDSLTGLYNKEYFFEKAEKYIRKNPKEDLYMVCTDIKGFKMINDFFGTKIGDRVLISFAKLLRENAGKAVAIGRLGNDIFGILIPKVYFEEEKVLQEGEDKLSAYMSTIVDFPMINYIGVYEITEQNLPISVMCDRARMAIASIKGDYHKRIAYYDNALRDEILYEQELINDLDAAISENQLKMYLQPQMSSDGRLLGAEALVRWMHPVKGQIMPSEFIPVFEKNGLISDVDKYIWETACKQLRKWYDEGKTDLYISVNISPRDFYFLNIYRIFTDLVEKYELDPKSLKLEITEAAVVMDFKRQVKLINRLRKTGFVVEMDDFGSGYSSLNMLKDIHVDVLKIDMAFLKKAEDEERSRKILRMIISLSNQLGMPVITEGVETEEQVKFLADMGCDMFQGYYFAKPMSVEDFEALYEKMKKEKPL